MHASGPHGFLLDTSRPDYIVFALLGTRSTLGGGIEVCVFSSESSLPSQLAVVFRVYVEFRIPALEFRV